MNDKSTLKHIVVLSTLLMMFTIIYSMIAIAKADALSSDNRYVQGSMITPTPILTAVPLLRTPVIEVVPEVTIIPISVWDAVAGVMNSPVFDELTENVIVISKSEHLDGSEELELLDLAVDRQLQFTIKGIKSSNFQFTNIYRIIKEEFYDEPIPVPSPTPIPTQKPEETKENNINNNTDNNANNNTEDNSVVLSDTASDIAKDANNSLDTHNQQVRIDEVIENNDPIHSRVVNYIEEESGILTAVITFNLDKTYVYKLVEDEAYFYICLMRPKDVYDKIVVIDSGHGLRDSGTYSKNYVYLEKDMNLSILLYLKELLDKDDDIKAYYTRTTDRRLTLNQRVNLANDIEADLFLSIHCNSSPAEQVNGTEVLYNELQNDQEGMNSKRFATICLEEAVGSIGLANRGIIPRSQNVHIIKAAMMPVAIIETAFMTNSKDLGVLVKKETHMALAEGLYRAIKRAYEEIEEYSE